MVILAVALLGSSCAPSTPTIVPTATENEFNEAVTKAHDTLDVVRKALLSPDPSYDFVGLKVRVYGEDSYEDIWTEPVDFYNGAFTTQMVEGVNLTTGYHPGKDVRVPIEDVIDWMIVEDDGNLIGGYTIRLAYEHMTPEEQKEFLRITGYVIK
jgi:uncharacterized protein YegJ (DUF2314 family)